MKNKEEFYKNMNNFYHQKSFQKLLPVLLETMVLIGLSMQHEGRNYLLTMVADHHNHRSTDNK